ncbi:phage tail protein [Anaerocolumna sp. MB42-C2]|uniref:hyaluronate lyase N-terminal domain-containing protein n=1 Tax=Anaerocolumna sp. MB42-C2 TaxID=3070997 RepID=UPI0027E0AF25|nr:phage tail protein [Anaerocolumna sp. MB42-C2]WMJ90619.1 phage tail protein [Anaerocolumna sp. MB42-C2]
MARKVLIQIMYGLEMNIGTLKSGELGFCTDTQKLYIGTSTGNVLLVAAQTAGDMLKSIYDTDNDGIVDAAEKVNGHTVLSDVPANAKFTDTVYTHPTTSGNKHVPSGGASGQILRWSADGTAVWGADNNTTYLPVTTSTNGLMSAADKAKLDGVENGANKYVHPGSGTNPHGTTKSDVGLGSVANYGVATQAEAEAGTSGSTYMTPLRVKQAIAANAFVGPLTWGQMKGE